MIGNFRKSLEIELLPAKRLASIKTPEAGPLIDMALGYVGGSAHLNQSLLIFSVALASICRIAGGSLLNRSVILLKVPCKQFKELETEQLEILPTQSHEVLGPPVDDK